MNWTIDLTWRFVAVWRRNMLVHLRFWFSNLLTNFFEPLVYLVGMGFGMGQFVSGIQGFPYQTYIAPGIIASSAMFAATFENTFGTFIRMTFQKTFDAIVDESGGCAVSLIVRYFACSDLFDGSAHEAALVAPLAVCSQGHGRCARTRRNQSL